MRITTVDVLLVKTVVKYPFPANYEVHKLSAKN